MSQTVSADAFDPSTTVRNKKTIFGHPAGLFVLFFTEMWERFSFYGMRALLVLYMLKYLIPATEAGKEVVGFQALRTYLESMFGVMTAQPLSSQIYGLYTAFVYLTPVFGGLLADRYLGQRNTVVLGGIIMAIGHFLMAIESLFLVALLFLIVGNGCFKPNISTQVGSLYAKGAGGRDRAFTIFYMGVNLGAMLAPLICGTLGQIYGWHYGFGAAGVGMIIGLVVYMWGQQFLPQDHRHILKSKQTVDSPLTSQEWRSIFALGVLCLVNIVFWAVYEQQGNTMQIFADQNVDWTVFGWTMPSSWFQSINPFFILVFAIPLTLFWTWQGNRRSEPSSVMKMSLGCTLLGGSFAVLMYVTAGGIADQKISFLWLVLCTLIYTIGELYLSPIGLSLVTKVAPVKYVSMLMGMWFLSSFFGNYLSGYIGTYYEKMSLNSFFFILLSLGVGAGIMILVLRRQLQKAFGNVA